MKRKSIIGSVSHGTMRPEDLVPTFLDTLKELSPRRYFQLKKDNPEVWEWLDDTSKANEEIDYFLNEVLFDALNLFAPPYFYFGAHPGDGSDYGFWLSENAIEEFEGLKVNDLSEIPKGYIGEVLLINDHGNTSLYWQGKRKLKDIWSVV